MLSGASARPAVRLLGCALAAGYSLENHSRACMHPIVRAHRADCTRAALAPTAGAATLSEYVPAAHHLLERRNPASSRRLAGDGFYPAESSTFKLFGETLNANGGTGEDWGQDGKELAVTIAQDLVQLGPFAAVQRFGTMAPRQASAFQHCDGVLGLAYSPVADSASLLKSLLTSARPSWHVKQPKTREMLAPAVFSLLTTEVGGELHLGGYDAAAAKGPVHFVDMMTDSGYTVAVTGTWNTAGTSSCEIGHEPTTKLSPPPRAHPMRSCVASLTRGRRVLSCPTGAWGICRRRPFAHSSVRT